MAEKGMAEWHRRSFRMPDNSDIIASASLIILLPYRGQANEFRAVGEGFPFHFHDRHNPLQMSVDGALVYPFLKKDVIC